MKNRCRNSAVSVGTKPGTARHKRAWPTLLVLAAAIAGTLTVGASSALAANPFTDFTTNFTRVESPNPQLKGRWSERLATVPDLNGDGKNEILIADLHESFSGFALAGRVYMQDGATHRFLYQIDSPEIQAGAQFGFFISVIGDVNGDGKADFVAGTDAQNVDAKTGLSCTLGATNCNKSQEGLGVQRRHRPDALLAHRSRPAGERSLRIADRARRRRQQRRHPGHHRRRLRQRRPSRLRAQP